VTFFPTSNGQPNFSMTAKVVNESTQNHHGWSSLMVTARDKTDRLTRKADVCWSMANFQASIRVGILPSGTVFLVSLPFSHQKLSRTVGRRKPNLPHGTWAVWKNLNLSHLPSTVMERYIRYPPFPSGSASGRCCKIRGQTPNKLGVPCAWDDSDDPFCLSWLEF